jgi:hypothetical protein
MNSERGGGAGEYGYLAAGRDRPGRGNSDRRCRGRCAGFHASSRGFDTRSPLRAATCYFDFGFDRAAGPSSAGVSGSQWFNRRVAGSRRVPPLRLDNIHQPNGLAVCDVEQPWRYGSILLRSDPRPRSPSEPGVRRRLQGIFRPEQASRHGQAQREAPGIRREGDLRRRRKLDGRRPDHLRGARRCSRVHVNQGISPEPRRRHRPAARLRP